MATTTDLTTLVSGEFSPELTYLNAAAMGLPPRRALRAVSESLDGWRSGRATAPAYDTFVTRSRASYAGLVGVAPARVAVGSQTSVFAGLVAASLPDSAEVLVAENEFTSIVFPFLAQAGRGVRTVEVPLDRLAESVTNRTGLVAVAAVQSADGRLIDLDALVAACAATDTRILLDTTQATGWLPVRADRFAYTVGGGYKWLLGPRGTCFFTVAEECQDDLVPHAAGWYAGESPWDSIYGAPLRLAPDARRFDVSPAWHSWVGQAEALDLLTEIGAPQLHAHAVGLANRFRSAAGLPPGDSAIVSLATDPGVPELLQKADVAASFRGGRLRLSFHLYNTTDDADHAADLLSAHVHP